MPKVFWTMLKERHGVAYAESLDSLLNITEHNARLKDFHRLTIRPLPVAHARNAACQAFWETTEIAGKEFEQSPEDTLVMLDCDHVMQADIVEKLAAHKKGVVGALATSRGETPFICFFGRREDGNIYNLSEWEDGELAEGVVVGSGALAIKRWVLYRLMHMQPSWFRYTYGGYRFEATEEMIFGYECDKAGIPHYCDTSLWIPHCTTAYTTPDEWRAWFKDHPETRAQVVLPPDYQDLVKPTGGDTWKERQAKDSYSNPNTAAIITQPT
jgi:hypothetical protein